jgi:hypothetical protein
VAIRFVCDRYLKPFSGDRFKTVGNVNVPSELLNLFVLGWIYSIALLFSGF